MNALILALLVSIPAGTSLPDVTPILRGDRAPYDGILLYPDTFEAYLRQDIVAKGAALQLQLRDDALKACIVKSTTPPDWWQTNGWWVGALLGGVAAGLGTWEVINITRKH